MKLTEKEKEIIRCLVWNELEYYNLKELEDTMEEVEIIEYIKELNEILKKVSK